MVETKTLLAASLGVVKEMLKPPEGLLQKASNVPNTETAPPHPGVLDDYAQSFLADDVKTKVPPAMVPVRALGTQHRERIAAHLQALDRDDRYFRFGYSATDEHIQRYVDGLDFERDDVFGVFNRKLELIAVAHLAFAPEQSPEECAESCAEFGVSVAKDARGLGLGSCLFDRAAMHARNEGVQLMFIQALSENAIMLGIARKAGAEVESMGAESEAYLRLPPANFDSRLTEMLEEQIAQADYLLKSQAKQFWEFLAEVRQVRRGLVESAKETIKESINESIKETLKETGNY